MSNDDYKAQWTPVYENFYKDIRANFVKRKYVEKGGSEVFEKVVFEHIANIYALIATLSELDKP